MINRLNLYFEVLPERLYPFRWWVLLLLAAVGAPLILKTLNISVSLDDFWGDYMREGVCAPTNIVPRSM